MKLRIRVACLLAAVSAVALTALRLYQAPLVAVLSLTGITMAAVLFLCGTHPRAPMQMNGIFAVLSAVAAAFTGAGLLVSGYDIAMGLLAEVYPYPEPLSVGFMGQVLLFVWLAGALTGGIMMLVVAVRWLQKRETVRVPLSILCLGPVVWTWGRLLWYMTSFTSAANRYSSLIEVLFLLCEMLFLLYLARYVSGVGDKESKLRLPLSVLTAMLGFTACVTRLGAFIMQTSDTFADAALITAPDYGVVLLAMAVTVSQLFGKPAPMPITAEEPESEVEETVEEGDEAEYVLDELMLAQTDEEDESEVVSDEERQPLELEDIINEIINRDS